MDGYLYIYTKAGVLKNSQCPAALLLAAVDKEELFTTVVAALNGLHVTILHRKTLLETVLIDEDARETHKKASLLFYAGKYSSLMLAMSRAGSSRCTL